MMDKLVSTARKIDVFFKIVDVLLKIAFVACLVCVVIVAVAGLFNLPDEMVGSFDQMLEIDHLTLHIADSYVPEFRSMLLQNALICVLAAVICFVAIFGVKTIRAILAPMKEGKPFHSEISKNLRKLGWLGLIISLMGQVLEAVSLLTVAATMKLENLLVSDKITHVDINVGFDLGVLIIPAVLFLLAYVFQYGEQLQTLSDETL